MPVHSWGPLLSEQVPLCTIFSHVVELTLAWQLMCQCNTTAVLLWGILYMDSYGLLEAKKIWRRWIDKERWLLWKWGNCAPCCERIEPFTFYRLIQVLRELGVENYLWGIWPYGFVLLFQWKSTEIPTQRDLGCLSGLCPVNYNQRNGEGRR